nr:hypothetical protein [Tanacetum cinerariifolium]
GGGACGMDVMIKSTWQAWSSTPPQSPSSSSSRSSSQGARVNELKMKNAMLLHTLEVTQSTNDALFDIVKNLARCDLEDE